MLILKQLIKVNDYSIVVSGAAGQGVKTVEEMLVGILKMSGYHIFATKEYESRVRGGTNSTELRISSHRVAAYVQRIDILIPLSKAVFKHLDSRLSEETVIIADPSNIHPDFLKNKEKIHTIPFIEIASEIGNKIFSNVVASGVIVGLFDANPDIAKNYLEERFKTKGVKIIEQNILAFKKGFDLGSQMLKDGILEINLEKNADVENEILFNGNQAVALGAIAGGCNFISAYPMSPSTGVLQFLAANSNEFEIVIDQAEDEIAAINKTVAAWYAGARALASTSGGGFALMTEGVSLAGIMESPLVIHIAQRPGPATGLPTRTAQEDLNLALYAGHGEFQRVIFAPGTIQQAFYLTQKAFNLADKFQVPVFILTDQDFVDAYYNIPSLDISHLKIDHSIIETQADYMRYKFTESGISPRGVPGYGNGLVRADSDEHDEQGHITEDMDYIRPEMMKKRLFKRGKLLEDVAELPTIIGEVEDSTAFVCWGSNYHVMKEAIESHKHQKIALVHFHQLYPLHPDTEKILRKAKKLVLIENNATGQFGNVLKLHANISIPKENQALRYTGKPYSVEEITLLISKEAL